MNRKAATNASHDATTGNRAVHQRANWNGVPIASTRIFHPFEFWVHDQANAGAGVVDDLIDARMAAHKTVKPAAVIPGWLRDLAMMVFRQVRGP